MDLSMFGTATAPSQGRRSGGGTKAGNGHSAQPTDFVFIINGRRVVQRAISARAAIHALRAECGTNPVSGGGVVKFDQCVQQGTQYPQSHTGIIHEIPKYESSWWFRYQSVDVPYLVQVKVSAMNLTQAKALFFKSHPDCKIVSVRQ